jgi:hypothetical protein
MVNKEHYEAAYWRVVSGIEAPKDRLEAMLTELVAAHFPLQDPKKEQRIVKAYLPEGMWRWPAYDTFVAERDAEFDDIEPSDTPDYREMVVFLARRISMIAYNLGHEAQLRSNTRLFPNWKFVASGVTEIPEKCLQMNGKVFRHDDPIWDGFPPCECLECCCHITIATGRDIDSSAK